MEGPVMVTGGTGFLGSHLVARLRALGHEVSVPRRADADLACPDAAERLFSEIRPRVVLHLAAEIGGIGANRSNPGRFWYANLMMGANVREQCRVHQVVKLVLVGTVCSYPELTPVPFREDDLWNGYPEETNASYGVAKKAVLAGAHAYRAQYGLNTAYLLPANLYGPGENFDPETSHVIPAIVRKMLVARATGSQTVTLWGDGSSTREFLYVDDCAGAIVLAAERYNGPDPVDLGTGEEIAIRDLATLVAEETGFTGDVVWDSTRPNGQPRRRLDTSRAAEYFGFEASTPLAEGLRRTVQWYLTTREGAQ